MRKIVIVGITMLVLAGCSSVNDAGNAGTPEQDSIASQASEAASEAANQAVEQFKDAEIAAQLETVALVLKAYSDLGGQMISSGGDLDIATMNVLTDGLRKVTTAAEDWRTYVDSIPEGAITPQLRQALAGYSSELNNYLADQEAGYDAWQACLVDRKLEDIQAATCVFERVDPSASVKATEKYIAALKALGTQLGLNIA